jgi:hypothetical protein
MKRILILMMALCVALLSCVPALAVNEDVEGELVIYTSMYPFVIEKMDAAIRADTAGRAHEVGAEIAFLLERREKLCAIVRLIEEGALPLRVTHNDTKLNNVMLDAQTRTPLCVIDLDTVMPGAMACDFGDSIRFGASTAAEDETDLSRVRLSMELYRAYAKGFLGACGASATGAERASLPVGARLMTLECGIRFLADYLNGDVYFHTSRPEHNLDRCRTQFKLVRDMEENWETLQRIVREETVNIKQFT